MRSALLVVHVAAGAVALVLAVRLLLGGGWAGRAGAGYAGAVVVVSGTALALAGPGSSLPPGVRAVLAVVAVLTAWAAVTGRTHLVAGRPHGRRRLDASVVSLITAVAVVSAPAAVWAAVAVAGTLLTERAHARRALAAPA